MSVPLGSLEDFLDEQLTQELPRSFMVRPTLTSSEESGAPSSRFANWRRGIAARFANTRQKMQDNQQRKAANKTSELTAPLQSEVDALKSELEALRNEMRMMKGEFKSKKGSNGSSGDETIETATPDPTGSGLPTLNFEITDSDEERLEKSLDLTPTARIQRFTTQAAFGDDQFSGWSRLSQPSGDGLPCVKTFLAASDSFDEERPMSKVTSLATQEAFGDDRFDGW